MACHSLFQGIFLIQELNPGLLHCRQILYCQSQERKPSRILSGLPCPSPGDLPAPGIKRVSTVSLALAGLFFSIEPPRIHFTFWNCCLLNMPWFQVFSLSPNPRFLFFFPCLLSFCWHFTTTLWIALFISTVKKTITLVCKHKAGIASHPRLHPVFHSALPSITQLCKGYLLNMS